MFDFVFGVHKSGTLFLLKVFEHQILTFLLGKKRSLLLCTYLNHLSSALGPKNLPFVARVVGHIVPTTLLPHADSLSTLYLIHLLSTSLALDQTLFLHY